MLALLMLAATLAPPPPPPPGTPPTTIADLVRIDGDCSLSVITVGDDSLSQRFNDAIIRAAKSEQRKFCHHSQGNYVISTNSNAMPTRGRSFRFDVSIHDARDFVDHYDSNRFATLGAEKGECAEPTDVCARKVVWALVQKLKAR
jgi:hypothetical protein